MRKFIALILFVSLLLAGCKPSMPRGILSPSKMEAVLYDYHYADNLPTEGYKGDVGHAAYTQAVLQKHHVSNEQFEQSLAYYMRHTEKLRDIYKRLEERYSAQLEAMGTHDAGAFTALTATGDTADIWPERRTLLLFPEKPYNLVSYEIPVDTAFHAGDQLQLKFSTNFFMLDGQREAFAVFTVTLGNDSVCVAQSQMTSTNQFSLRLQDFKQLGIKRVRGYFLMNSHASKQASAQLRMLMVNKLQLIRIHTPQTASLTPPDTTKILNEPLLDSQRAPMTSSTGPDEEVNGPLSEGQRAPMTTPRKLERRTIGSGRVEKRAPMTPEQRAQRTDSIRRMRQQRANEIKNNPPRRLQ